MDGLIIWTVGRVQAERAARTRTLNRTQCTEKPLFEFYRGKKRKHMEKTSFPGGSVVKNPPASAEDAGSVLGLERWQPTPVFLPGKSPGQRNLAGCGPWGCKRVRHDLATKQQQALLLSSFYK